MKTRTKAMLLALSAILLVVSTVFATMAFLTSTTDVVTNTFTVGNVIITLDETDVDNDTNATDNVVVGNVTRDRANAYHLLPNKQYDKDPIVHVNPASEDCFIFVKVTNNISDIEAASGDGYINIAEQITANGWLPVTDANDNVIPGIYYHEIKFEKNGQKYDYAVFQNFKIRNDVDNATLANYATTQNNEKYIEIQAYAIQAEGFDDAQEAWAAAPATWGN